MGNCLETKLKESVNNDALSILGCIRVKLNTDAYGDIYLAGVAGNDVILKILTDGVTINSATGQNYRIIDDTTVRVGDYTETLNSKVRLSAANTIVECIISNKYNIAELVYVCDAEDELSYLIGLKNLRLRNYDGKVIKLSSLVQSTGLESINAATDHLLIGSVKDLAIKENLTTMRIQNGSVTDSIEDFVAIRKNLGQTSGSVQAYLTGTDITFNDAACGDSTIAWEESGNNTVITFNGVSTTIHVNPDGTWTRIS